MSEKPHPVTNRGRRLGKTDASWQMAMLEAGFTREEIRYARLVVELQDAGVLRRETRPHA